MTGIVIRVERDKKFQNIELEDLTDEERKTFFKDYDNAECVDWINVLCAWIKKNVKEDR